VVKKQISILVLASALIVGIIVAITSMPASEDKEFNRVVDEISHNFNTMDPDQFAQLLDAMVGESSSSVAPTASDETIKITTYNIRREGSEKDSKNLWHNRKQLVFNLIKEINPAILGLQEVVKSQLADLAAALPNYKYFGEPRSAQSSWLQWAVMFHPRAKDEYSPIFYDEKRVILLEKDSLGINPRNWIMTAYLPRVCTVGLFKDIKSGKKFYVYNTHLDNGKDFIRAKQIEMILADVKKRTQGLPVIIMGDFNTPLSGKEPVASAIRQSFDAAEFIKLDPAIKAEGPMETRTGWNNNELKIIDHIRTKGAKVLKYVVVTSPEGVYPSDHRPVMVDIALQ
jgi:endonuclease/exonuclease/phosphatase family metal-dependent hydrolase